MREVLKKLNKQKVIDAVLFLLFKLVYELFYVLSYVRLKNEVLELSIPRFVIGWVIYGLIVYIALKYIRDRFLSTAFNFLIILSFMTSSVIFQFAGRPVLSYIKILVYWLVLLLFFIYMSKTIVGKEKMDRSQDRTGVEGPSSLSVKAKDGTLLERLIGGASIFDLVLLIATVVVLFMSWKYAGFRFVLRFNDSLDFRMNMRGQEVPALIGYAFAWAGGTLLPLCFAFYLQKKKFVLALLSFVIGILAYSVNGMKTWLLAYLLILAIMVFEIGRKNLTIKAALAIMIVWISVSWALWDILKIPKSAYYLERAVQMPALIGYNYIEFFDNHEFLWLRESLLRGFFESPYPNGSDFYIVAGAEATLTTARANNGLWGDAYKNFAMLGMLIYPIMLSGVLYVLRKYTLKIGQGFAYAILALVLWACINTSFFTWLMTGGMLPVLVVCFAHEIISKFKAKNRIGKGHY